MVYMAPDTSSVPTMIGNVSSWSLNMTADDIEVSCFVDTNKTYVRGFSDAALQLQGYFDNADDTILSASESSVGATVYLYPNKGIAGDYWWGNFLMDATIQADVKGAITLNANGKAAGTITRVHS